MAMRLTGNEGVTDIGVNWLSRDKDEKWIEDSAGGASTNPTVTPVLMLRPANTRRPVALVPLTVPEVVLPKRSLSSLVPLNTIFVRSSSLDMVEVVNLFEAIAGTDVEAEVSGLLKWIITDAERLLTKGVSDERTIYVKRHGRSHPEPLRAFGDGAFRLTALALALVNSKDGCCLLDEIENGIHYELFDQIWEKLSLLSQALNVQVFATTHGKDCIEAFERSYRHPHFDACFHRLEREGGRIVPIRLDNDSYFSVVAGQEHEIR